MQATCCTLLLDQVPDVPPGFCKTVHKLVSSSTQAGRRVRALMTQPSGFAPASIHAQLCPAPHLQEVVEHQREQLAALEKLLRERSTALAEARDRAASSASERDSGEATMRDLSSRHSKVLAEKQVRVAAGLGGPAGCWPCHVAVPVHNILVFV